MFKSLHRMGLACFIAVFLGGCGAPLVRQGAAQTPGESASAPAADAGSYRIDASRSELRILVYRAGPLAHFGHNHVMVNREISGSVDFGGEAAGSAFMLNVPVLSFIVDDAQARRDEGPDFAGEIPEEAKSGTLRNMLSAAVLDADEYPAITLKGVSAHGAPDESRGGTLNVTVAVTVAGHESTIDAPVTFSSGPGRLSATGSLEVRQSVLGLSPYSLMRGALQVQDALRIKFRMVAIRN